MQIKQDLDMKAKAIFWCLLLVLLFLSSLESAGQTTFRTTSSGNWNDPIWDQPGSPSATDYAVIEHDVTLTQNETIDRLTIEKNDLNIGSHTLTVTKTGATSIAVHMNCTTDNTSCFLIIQDGGSLQINQGDLVFTKNISTLSGEIQRILMSGNYSGANLTISNGNLIINYIQADDERNDEVRVQDMSTVNIPKGSLELNYQGSSGVIRNLTFVVDNSATLTAKNIVINQQGVDNTSTGSATLETRANSTVNIVQDMGSGGNLQLNYVGGNGNAQINNGRQGETDASNWNIDGSIELISTGTGNSASGGVRYRQSSLGNAIVDGDIIITHTNKSNSEKAKFDLQNGTLEAQNMTIISQNDNSSSRTIVKVGSILQSQNTSASLTINNNITTTMFDNLTNDAGTDSLWVLNGSDLTVGGNFNLTMNQADDLSEDFIFHITGSSSIVSVQQNIMFDVNDNGGTTGNKTKIQIDNGSQLVSNDLTFEIIDLQRYCLLTLGNGSLLALSGNFSFTPGVDPLTAFPASTLELTGTAQQSIDAEIGSLGNLTLNNTFNTTGEVTVTDLNGVGSLDIDGDLTLNNCVLFNQASVDLTVASGGTITTTNGFINGPLIRRGTAGYFPVGDGRRGAVTISGLGQSTDEFKVQHFVGDYRDVFGSIDLNTIAKVSTLEYWLIQEIANGGSDENIQVTLHWTDDAVSQIGSQPYSHSDLLVAATGGGPWVDLQNSLSDQAMEGSGIDGYVTSNLTLNQSAIAHPSLNTLFSLGSSDPTVLPVEWLSFQANEKDGKAHLKWSTATELNNDYFQIERSSNGIEFETIGQVDGAGNSSAALHYEYVDHNPTYPYCFYRIKQVDFDGGFDYSSIVRLDLNNASEKKLSVYPNPVESDEVYINIDFQKLVNPGDPYTLELVDLSGQVIARLESENATPGLLRLPLDSERTKGASIVLLNLITKDGEIYSEKISFR